MNMLPTNAQVQTWRRLTRQQLLATIVLLVLLAAMAIGLLGAGYSVGEQAYSVSLLKIIS